MYRTGKCIAWRRDFRNALEIIAASISAGVGVDNIPLSMLNSMHQGPLDQHSCILQHHRIWKSHVTLQPFKQSNNSPAVAAPEGFAVHLADRSQCGVYSQALLYSVSIWLCHR